MGYNMKGWSGFQNSPMKQTVTRGAKESMKYEKDEAFRKRNTAILKNDNAQEQLYYDLENEKISQEEFNIKMAELRKEEKEIKKALPK